MLNRVETMDKMIFMCLMLYICHKPPFLQEVDIIFSPYLQISHVFHYNKYVHK